MARFTYELSPFGASVRMMAQHGPDAGQYLDTPRFTMATGEGRVPFCRQTCDPVPAGQLVVTDRERSLEYCAHCANDAVGGQIVTAVRVRVLDISGGNIIEDYDRPDDDDTYHLNYDQD